MPDQESDQLRPAIHYLATLVLIGIYGVQVCPFIDTLTPLQLAVPLLIIVVVQFVLRILIAPGLINTAGYKNQATKTFRWNSGCLCYPC